MDGKILIIDDEEKLRGLLGRLIRTEGYTVIEAGTLKAGVKMAEKEQPDVVLCDGKLPDGNGVDFVATLKKQVPAGEIILLTAYGNIPDGVQAIKNGAYDYLTKGDDNDRLLPLISKAMEKVQLQKRVIQLEARAGKRYSFENISGQSAAIKTAVRLAKKVAATDATVLLLGETGTGKEVFAQAIHNEGARTGKSFVALNCSAFARDIIESELFGHRAGAFTGATKDKKGLIEEANGGTLFLDEIGEMPIELQSKLLRVLETAEFIKVGDTKPVKVDVRIIAATNRDLTNEIKASAFREDLYYRLNVFNISLPPLRDRRDDIPALAIYYTRLFATKTNKTIQTVTPDAIAMLQHYPWKGNVRELKNVIERAVILEDSDMLTTDNMPFELRTASDKVMNEFELANIERIHIGKVLAHTGGNKTEAARLLNIGLTTLYRKIEEFGF